MLLQAVQAPAAKLSSEDEHREALEEQRCSTAYEAVQDFEQSHCLVAPSMGQPYFEVELLSSQACRHSRWLPACTRFLVGPQVLHTHKCRLPCQAGMLACLVPWQARPRSLD